ncbi:MAG: glycosyltransferase [Pseudonocardiaceae bacterium]
MSAVGNVEWRGGTDMYGLDMMIEMLGRIRKTYPRVGLVVCLWGYQDATDAAYLKALHDRATSSGCNLAVHFNREVGSLLPVLAASQAFLRPTVTDGDSNSVREALDLGIHVVASDAVGRPSGVVTFPNRDQRAFEAAVLEVLSGRQVLHEAPNGVGKRTAQYLSEISSWRHAERG